jgi:hypothetical protein
MPVVLWPEAWPVWLGEEPADPRQLKALLAPYPSKGTTCWPVGPRWQRQEQMTRASSSRLRCKESLILGLIGCAPTAIGQSKLPHRPTHEIAGRTSAPVAVACRGT